MSEYDSIQLRVIHKLYRQDSKQMLSSSWRPKYGPINEYPEKRVSLAAFQSVDCVARKKGAKSDVLSDSWHRRFCRWSRIIFRAYRAHSGRYGHGMAYVFVQHLDPSHG